MPNEFDPLDRCGVLQIGEVRRVVSVDVLTGEIVAMLDPPGVQYRGTWAGLAAARNAVLEGHAQS